MRRKRFHWDAWNRGHIAKHAVSRAEAEFVVRHAKPPYPRRDGEKFIVWGITNGGRLLQVIFVLRAADEIDYDQLTLNEVAELQDSSGKLAYIVHARDLTAREKSQYRRFK